MCMYFYCMLCQKWLNKNVQSYCNTLRNCNKLFLRDKYIPRVVVALTMSWMIRYSYFTVFSISQYGYKYHVTLFIGQLHPITVYMTGFGVCVVLVLSVIMCSF